MIGVLRLDWVKNPRTGLQELKGIMYRGLKNSKGQRTSRSSSPAVLNLVQGKSIVTRNS
jgi:hypothetical protein